MSIEVTETIKRWCCQPKDLVALDAKKAADMRYGGEPEWKFCKHCGRWHRADTFMDPAGSRDWHYVAQPFPWETKA